MLSHIYLYYIYWHSMGLGDMILYCHLGGMTVRCPHCRYLVRVALTALHPNYSYTISHGYAYLSYNYEL
jgi:hypothetical protein